ncbi:MAG TPA: patatin-like phospholipase family protein [Myxococcaceae bacterium]|nr:patatin-like phospholipase family protein [Myxococcaceae bacterium]
MLRARSKRLLLVAAALAFFPLLREASGAGELGGERPGIVALEVAGTAGRARTILERWGPPGVRAAARAVEWDFAFIVSYVLVGGLVLTAVARRARAGWARIGLLAVLAVMAAGTAGFGENLALLAVLAGSLGFALPAAVCAWAKFGLLAVAAAAAAVAAGGLRKSTAPVPQLDWNERDLPSDSSGLLPCDLVMKGGITSGVVYPGAAFALAQRYRFVNIGGSSAGAIAAAVTAAAEYRRSSQRTTAGFARLRDVTASLAAEDRLLDLFQPTPACAALFDLLAAALRPGAAAERVLCAAWTAVTVFPVATVASLLPAIALALGASASVPPAGAAWVFLAGVLLSALLLPLFLAGAAAWSAWRALPAADFGLCPGTVQGKGSGKALSDWLADTVDEIAFGEDWAQTAPLTLGHLYCGRPPTPEEARRRSENPALREINLEVLTTSLTHGRPYRLPFDSVRMWFRPAELKRVLPGRIVDFMEQAGRKVPPPRRLPPLPSGVVALPEPEDLPVVFLARMSLSFPFLLAATKLVGIHVPLGRGARRDLGPDVDDSRADGEDGPAEVDARARYDSHWFSDGGFSSNFPIHFFDQPLPTWPTFGLDLGEAPPGTPDADRILVPHTNNQGILAPWQPIRRVPQFVGALFSSLHAWMDNLQKRAPGYRDRVVRIDLTPDEGGLNLRMPGERVLRIAGFGRSAGEQLGAWFDPGGGGASPRPGQAPPMRAWDNHRWVRFRSTLAVLEGMLRTFGPAFRARPPPGARTFDDMLLERNGPPPSYPYPNAALRARAQALEQVLAGAPVGDPPGLSSRAPRPEPQLRITPKV